MKLACFQEEFTQAATALLAKHGKTLEDVKPPTQAWEVCWRCESVLYTYRVRKVLVNANS